MKKILKVIVISMVIIGLVAAYVFSGIAPVQQPIPETPQIENEALYNALRQQNEFQGPPSGSAPSVVGPGSAPQSSGPSTE